MTSAYILPNNRITTNLLSARASHYEYYPLVKGNVAPSFIVKPENSIGNDAADLFGDLRSHATIQDLMPVNNLLIIAFYPGGTSRNTDLLFFESLQQAVNEHGSRLLIITSQQLSSFNKHNTSLNRLHIFHDERNRIAKSFGLYDPYNPLWNWVPGIEESEVFLPAFYGVTMDKEIRYHHIDYKFELFNSPDILQQQKLIQQLSALVADGKKADVLYPFPVIDFLR